MNGFFVRLQKPGLGWDPLHRSNHPRPSDGLNPYPAYPPSQEYYELPGMAAYPIVSPSEFIRAVAGRNFVISTESGLPPLEEGSRHPVDPSTLVTLADVETFRDVLLFYGRIVAVVNNGVVASPLPIDDLLKAYIEVYGNADIDRDAYEIIVEEGGIDHFMESIVCAEPETGLICLFEFVPI